MKTSARVSPISPSSRSSSLPACPTNGRPCSSSFAPGRLADEHQVGVGVARAEDDGGAGRGELRAARAVPRLVVDGLERVAALLLRRRHDPKRRPRRGRRSGAKAATCVVPCPRGGNLWTASDRHPESGAGSESDARHDRHRGRRPSRPRPGRRPADRRDPLGRGYAGAGADVVLLCVPDARDRRRRARPSPRARSSATARARRGSTSLAPARGLRAASAHDRHPRGRRLRRRRLRDRRQRRRAPWTSPAAGRRAGHAGLRDRRRGPRRLPRRRVDGLELPRHARGRRRAAWRPRRASSASCSSRWCARRSSAGRARATPR